MSQEKVLVRKVNISEKEKVRYEHFRVNIPEEQREKLLSAICDREAVSIRFRHEDLSGGDDLIAFTEQQFKIITIAFEKGREVIINMSKEQVHKHTAAMDIVYYEDDYFFLPLP